MPRIKEDYDEYVKGVPDTGDADSWWKYACARAQVMLNEETDEVKQNVEEIRESSIATDVHGLDAFMEPNTELENAVPDDANMQKRAHQINE